MTAVMGHFIFYLRSTLKYFFPHSRNPFLVERTPYGLPTPLIKHKVVQEEELGQRRLLMIGDVHGCYDELIELLDKCQAARDSSKTALVFVGDLCNKGPKNAEVVSLVRDLGGYCVRGNHDEVSLAMLEQYKDGRSTELDPKFTWLKDLTQEELDWYYDLPFSIQFPSRQVIVVHAGLIPGIRLEKQSLDDLLHLRSVVFNVRSLTFSSVKEDNNVINIQPWAQTWTGPEHIYFGHDALRFLQRYDFATGIDTGCVYGGQLTAVFDDDRETLIQVKAHKVHDQGSSKSPPPHLPSSPQTI